MDQNVCKNLDPCGQSALQEVCPNLHRPQHYGGALFHLTLTAGGQGTASLLETLASQ